MLQYQLAFLIGSRFPVGSGCLYFSGI
jgi:hypothetical protein